MIDGGGLHIVATRPACELPGGSPKRAAALCALRGFIEGESGAAFGLDFPFGLPRPMVAESNWKEFVLAFSGRYRSAAAFRETCRTLSARELRRATNRQARTPWAAWNWRLYRQTYYGIGSILAPLVSEDRVRVLPMDSLDGIRPVLLEICPASTLRRLGLRGLPYKGEASLVKRAARQEILARLVQSRHISLDAAPAARALDDPGGDAVDSIVAAIATFEALARGSLPPQGAYDPVEGFVYV